MAREVYEISVPTAIDTRTVMTMPANARGITRLHIGGKWGSAEDLKVQHASDRRIDQAVWTDVAGNVTGNGATWVKGTKNVPREALFVAIYAVHDITQGSPPARAWLIVNEGSRA